MVFSKNKRKNRTINKNKSIRKNRTKYGGATMTPEQILESKKRMEQLNKEEKEQRIKEHQQRIEESQRIIAALDELPSGRANTSYTQNEFQPIQNKFKILVFLHGCLTGSLPIPKEPADKVITLSGLGGTCKIIPACDEGLITIYQNGNSIYHNDDNDTNLTTEGNSIKEWCGFEFKNHINEDYINNVIISTRGEVPGAAKIVVLIKLEQKYTKIREIIPQTDWDLKKLFTYCRTEFVGERTYILRTCRVWPNFGEDSQFEEPYKSMTRTVSANTYSGAVDDDNDEARDQLIKEPPLTIKFKSSSKQSKPPSSSTVNTNERTHKKSSSRKTRKYTTKSPPFKLDFSSKKGI